MKRREFIALLGGAAIIWPLGTSAQQHIRRVAVLSVGVAPQSREFALAHELAKLGYIEGNNITYDIRGAEGDSSRLPQLALELVAKKPEVIVGSTSTVAVVLANATREIPIVMMVVGDPIALGLSNSMSHPSRNVTGFTMSTTALAAKRLELLRELVPGIRKVAFLRVRDNPITKRTGEEVQTAADMLDLKIVPLPVASGADITTAFTIAEKEGVTALLIDGDPLMVRFSGTIIDECLVRDLPAMHPWPFEVRNGALISYGPATVENYSRTALYVDRILRGISIGELPFEEPTQIKLAINLRTARSIGVTVSPTLLARADEVIE
ncbi:MAG TPA: ABC transporter substrate-binding protein [Pseudolabrys sp.]|nr:ABC transporter substrate-binding protein [Pseudolabrys sp.]